MFSEKDIVDIESHGLTTDKIKDQMASIQSGMVYSKLKEAATIGNGIFKIDQRQESHFIELFDKYRSNFSIVKFVPASGAATRMFKFLFEFLNNYHEGDIDFYIEKSGNKNLSKFLEELEKFSFFEDVVHKIHKIIPRYNDLSYEEQRLEFVKTMLDEDRLNYGFFPKGLLPFHKNKNYTSTAFEEHLFEAAFYGSSNNKANLHFTVSEMHKDKFQEELNHILDDVENQTGHTFDISFSYQKKSTDTIALTTNNELLRDTHGNMVFRPSGHGALLENLNDLDCDIIFIKNIDNVVVKAHQQNISDYKKLLAGILIEAQEQAFNFLHQLKTQNINQNDIDKITDFLINKLNVVVPSDFNTYSFDIKVKYLQDRLNRPIRVCGMVKNEGEPGGGPFWVEDKNSNVSLQIVESAQVDTNNENQMKILKRATHFNPVDLVCGVKNYKGEPFDLTKYVDYNTAFITEKNHGGEVIKALELPGLWNGSMAFWNTIFVEVPLSTFNPVKTVNDLLRSPHQVKS